MKKMLFIGGDKRMIYAARRLSERFSCTTLGLGEAARDEFGEPCSCGFDYIVLPLPASLDGEHICCPLGEEITFAELGGLAKRGGTVFTSKSFPLLSRVCRENGLSEVNYFEREELAVLNAVPTAEGALAAAINELPVMLNGQNVLITGYGRIGKITARYFAALGARVFVSARKPSDLAWITAEGHTAVDFRDADAFHKALSEAALIINTVPFKIIDEKAAAACKKGALLIELASSPCIGKADALKNNIRVVSAGGLPGRLAPVTAGDIIAAAIENIIDEGGGADDRA